MTGAVTGRGGEENSLPLFTPWVPPPVRDRSPPLPPHYCHPRCCCRCLQGLAVCMHRSELLHATTQFLVLEGMRTGPCPGSAHESAWYCRYSRCSNVVSEARLLLRPCPPATSLSSCTASTHTQARCRTVKLRQAMMQTS